MIYLLFRNKDVLVSSERIPSRLRDKDYNYYEIGCEDVGDSRTPMVIKKQVQVGFCGTMLSRECLFPNIVRDTDTYYITPSKEEKQVLKTALEYN